MRNPAPKEWKDDEWSQGYIADYKPFSFVDGEGVRCSLYVSGCLFQCPGCYNRAAQSFSYGHPYTQSLENQILSDLSKEYVQGLSLLGGEPFLNTSIILPLVSRMREMFGDKKDIWCWTGYTFEELLVETSDKLQLLAEMDVVVDGRFRLEEKDLGLAFRGSRNQRIINVPASLEKGRVILMGASHSSPESV